MRHSSLIEKLQNKRPLSVFRDLQHSLLENEKFYEGHTYAPSQAVLRNLNKSKGKLCNRYSDNWVSNLQTMLEKYKQFKRDFSVINPWVILFTDAQLLAYSEICQTDIVYFDATCSVLQNSSDGKLYQIYNFVIRNTYVDESSLPVAIFISSRHDADTIRYFKESD